jgi:hypothetical protein
MLFGINMTCANCKIEVGNRLVVMADNSVWCYTCGRLRADQRCRRMAIFVECVEALEERRDLNK